MDKFLKFPTNLRFLYYVHCVKSVQIWSYLSDFSRNAGKYGPEKTPYLDTFHAAVVKSLPTLMFSRVLNTVIKLSINNISR